MQRKSILPKYMIITLLLSSTLWSIDINSKEEAVNIAGKQRMFTQKMLKDYAMIGMHNTFGNPQKDLTDTITAFDDHLASLKQYTKDSNILKSIEETQALWKPIKKTLQETPDAKKAEQLQVDLEALLKASDKTTKLFAKASGKKSGEVINIAGRQRMLSQRMASLYMLQVWGVKDPQFKKKLNDAMTLFKTSLDTLEKSAMNTTEIETLLSKTKRSFMFLEMMSRSKSKFIPTLIYKKSDDMLKNMNSATQLYTQISSK